jgi:uncharacterized protein with PIN domain
MRVTQEIKKIKLGEEFRICPQCGYELGFHSSFLREEGDFKIVFICPECGARYDVGWNI